MLFFSFNHYAAQVDSSSQFPFSVFLLFNRFRNAARRRPQPFRVTELRLFRVECASGIRSLCGAGKLDGAALRCAGRPFRPDRDEDAFAGRARLPLSFRVLSFAAV